MVGSCSFRVSKVVVIAILLRGVFDPEFAVIAVACKVDRYAWIRTTLLNSRTMSLPLSLSVSVSLLPECSLSTVGTATVIQYTMVDLLVLAISATMLIIARVRKTDRSQPLEPGG